MTSRLIQSPPFWRRLTLWASRVNLANRLAVALMVAALVAGTVTYAALTESQPFGDDPDTILILLNLDLVVLLLLAVLVALRVASLWARRRRRAAASRLHVRLVALFSLVAVAPAIVVAVFSAVFFFVGMQSWFSERVSTAVNESLSVAQAYLAEHQETLRADALAMANDLNRDSVRLLDDPTFFDQFVSTQALIRELTEALVFDGQGRPLARSTLTFALQFESISDDVLDRARDGEVVLLTNDADDRVRAVVQLDRFVDTFLLVGRLVEPRVIGHMERAEGAVSEFQQIQGKQSFLQITFSSIYVVVALLLLLVAAWFGLGLADTLVMPISALIEAAERVRAGDLGVRVPVTNKADELAVLSRSFNRMTHQIETQQRELIEANRQLDLRRRFTETVLAGVSAGVIGLDEQGGINLPNRSATELLGRSMDDLLGRRLDEAVPEMAELFDAVRRRPGRLVEGQVNLRQASGTRTLLVRIAAEHLDGSIRGYVATFDDITELLSAQRKAAWADVARRIAHEIKNPLTPIQLSAERLKRKYLAQIETDRDVFAACTDTIVRQVGDIGRMVDEFSAFARMPTPVIKPQDLAQICGQAASLQRHAHPGIDIAFAELPSGPCIVPCDGRQVSQALTNLLQNALDAIDARHRADPAAPPGEIRVRLAVGVDTATVSVEDNGKGLPAEDRDRLTEPYVTTRAEGTGLGLAIVKKIMEDHDGRISLEDRAGGGARVRLIFPLAGAGSAHAGEAQRANG